MGVLAANGSSNGADMATSEPDQPLISKAVGGQVQALIDAAEEAARAITDRAEADAESLKRAAREEADELRRELRREAATRAARDVELVANEALRGLDAKAASLRAAIDELQAEADQTAANLRRLGHGLLPPMPGTAREPTDEERRARMVAVTMASNGASREETARYIADHCRVPDPGAVVDAAYR